MPAFFRLPGRRAERLLILSLLLAAAAAAWLFFPRGERHFAEIAIDGRVVCIIDLDAAEEPYQTDLSAYGLPVSFEVRSGSVRFIKSSCPDHICEQTGWIGALNPVAVCMPNRVSLTYRAES